MANQETEQVPEWMKTLEGILGRINDLKDEAISDARIAGGGAAASVFGIATILMSASPDTPVSIFKWLGAGVGLVFSIVGPILAVNSGLESINKVNEANSLQAALVSRISGPK